MKHLSSLVLAVALIAAGATACFKDPTSSLRNGPNRIELSRSSLFINVGDSISIQATVKDAAGNTFDAADAVWTSSVPAIIEVNRAAVTVPFDAFSRVFVRAVAPGLSWVFITTQGLTDSVQVYGLPLTFNGAVGPATSSVGDTLTISGTSVLGFSTAAGSESEVTVGGQPVWLLSRTASQIKVIAPPAASGSHVTITNVVMLGTVAIAELDATTTVTVTEANEPANNDPATPTALTLYVDKYGTVDGSDLDDFFRFTTPATDDSVNVAISWNTDSDIDALVLNATASDLWACVIDGCSMASGANPETKNLRLAANTTYQILVEMYDVHSAEGPVLFRVRTTKIQ